jgi:transcription-repair coupling factor (superfamily II helicase)
MSNHYFKCPALPASGLTQTWRGLPGASRALSLLSAVQQATQPTFLLAVTRDGNETEDLFEALQFFSGSSQAQSNTSPVNTQTKEQVSVVQLPDQETLPYDHFSPHPDIISDRLNTLYRLQNDNALQHKGICIISAGALMARLCPRSYINQHSLVVQVGETLRIEQLKRRLVEVGYQHRESVFEHGDFAVRGSVLDLFPMGSQLPYRIELFDTEIESLRTFDPENQRSLDRIDALSILPAGEVAFDKTAINHFRDQWHNEFNHDPDICPVHGDTVAGIISAGIEAYLPMFFDSTETIFDYLPEHSVICSYPELEDSLQGFRREAERRYTQQNIDPTRPLLAPDKLFLAIDECFGAIKRSGHIKICGLPAIEPSHPERGEYVFNCSTNAQLLIDDHSKTPLQNIENFILDSEHEHTKLLFCVDSLGRREVLLEKLNAAGIATVAVEQWGDFLTSDDQAHQAHGVSVTSFNRGAWLHDLNIAIVAEPELFGITIKPKARKNRDKNTLAEATIHSLVELRVGAPIVHIDHGVGRYLGLECMPVPVSQNHSIDAEFMTLEYAGGDKLYVPVTAMHLISRYMGGDENTAPLNKLGTDSWGNAKRKAIANVRDVAAELLAIYAKRKAMQGFAHGLEADDYRRFCEQFPFEETVDQQNAIDAVVSDMQSQQAMDRLVCGDVGFGKTEVAMRAAFVAVNNSKQVMVLVPTTLLAQQHFQNFQDRLADWPVKIDTLSRFRSASEQKSVLANFASGNIDILIGTHKLIQKSIVAKDLGLVVVDEEHRFGVSQKEQLKRLCANVDLLTMTATPIPRTLNMAMAGLRDLSIITTPPARRLSVKTFVREKQTSLVQEAMLRELLRGGQVFYLHNDVSSIERTAREIEELLPDARVTVGHGQMPERQLEQVMADFYHKKYNVLVCTTIIENGIDIPNANTIVIERADKFGLAQLHQLRGRVGRSHHQAYAYLFIPQRKRLTKDAEKRLQAIEESQDLGAGFMLATHDLEIRGAGELLGSDQSGQIQSIGFSLYLDMLDRAVNSLNAGEEIDLTSPLEIQGEMNLHLPALIPHNYLPDIHNRLILYKRIASAESNEALRDIQVEMIDRFGLLRDEIRNLFTLMELKLAARPIGIKKIDSGERGGFVEFTTKTTVDPMTIVSMVQDSPHIFQLKGATRLNFKLDLPESSDRIEWVSALILQLSNA